MRPTAEQQAILEKEGHLVVLARPGSGKTYTLSKIIQNQLQVLPDFRGVIAISYTNKASKELEVRSLEGVNTYSSSFFGTTHGFVLKEIVLEFISHFTKNPPKDFSIIKYRECETLITNYEDLVRACTTRTLLSGTEFEFLINLYERGYIVLEAATKLALTILANSESCQRYIKARYSHVIIDEYQDSGWDQHTLFLSLQSLGLIAIAVGDLDQSIYGYDGKDSSYLSTLAGHVDFTLCQLSLNHRSHPSIVNYASSFMFPSPVLLPSDSHRVCIRDVPGSEADIATSIQRFISQMETKGYVSERSSIGILCRGNRTADIIRRNIGIPIKYSRENELDVNGQAWSLIFKNLLLMINNAMDAIAFAGNYASELYSQKLFKTILVAANELKQSFVANARLGLKIEEFKAIAELIAPDKKSDISLKLLQSVLSDEEMFISYRPPDSSEVQLMTLHKSKGLEFDIVFHLDLYDYVIPSYAAMKGDEDIVQCRNLHYVGITRAKSYCILVVSDKRTNSSGNIVSVSRSSFINEKNLHLLRANGV